MRGGAKGSDDRKPTTPRALGWQGLTTAVIPSRRISSAVPKPIGIN
jgi:hypothetical protein